MTICFGLIRDIRPTGCPSSAQSMGCTLFKEGKFPKRTSWPSHRACKQSYIGLVRYTRVGVFPDRKSKAAVCGLHAWTEVGILKHTLIYSEEKCRSW